MTRWPLPAPMKLALQAARDAAAVGEVPVGAVVMRGDDVIAVAGNATRTPPDPTGHAELRAIRMAAQALGDDRLVACDLYVTLEPCAMCAGAIQAARIPKVIFGAYDPAVGAAGSRYDLLRDEKLGQQTEVIGGVLQHECAALIERFFQDRRR